MNENDSFEKLVRNQLKDAAQTPPAEVWDAIESSLPATDGVSPSRPVRRGRVAMVSAFATTVVAAAVICFSVMRAKPEPEPAVAKQQSVASLPAKVEDNSAVDVAQLAAAEPERDCKSNAAAVVAPSEVKIQVPSEGESLPSQTIVATATQPVAAEINRDEPEEKGPAVAIPQPSEKGRAEVAAAPAEKQGPRDTAVHSQKPPTIVIPNLLTPNGDGFNDCWVIPGLEEYGTVQVQIYTAKSQRVFSSTDYHNEFCGDDCPDGNYFYVIGFRDLNLSRRGVLVIKR